MWRIFMAACFCISTIAALGDDTSVRIAILAGEGERAPKAGVVDLLTVSLSRERGIALVEREHIDRVLNEQVISSVFSPGSVGKRAEIGRLLGADLLVSLAYRKGDVPFYELIGSESSTGMRRYRGRVPATGKIEADVRTIHEKILDAVAVHQQPVRVVCAVPPFVCADLSFDHSRWKGAYMRLVEMELMGMQEVAVVEFEEAQAISEELRIVGKQTSVSRHLPFYFLGEYRMDRRNPANPPFIRVVLRQGTTTLGQQELTDDVETSGAAFIRSAVRKLAVMHLEQSASEGDRAKEVAILRDRARRLFTLGRFAETAELAEACLLLDTRDSEIRKLAFVSYGRMARALTVKNGVYTKAPDPLRLSLRYSAIGIQHLEGYLRLVAPDEMPPSLSNLMSECGCFSASGIKGSGDVDLIAQLNVLSTGYKDMCIRVLEFRYANRTLTHHFMSALLGRSIRCYAGTLEASLGYRLRIARLLAGAKSPFHNGLIGQYMQDLLDDGIHERKKEGAAYTAFLNQLKDLNHPFVRDLVSAEERAIVQRRKAVPNRPRAAVAPRKKPKTPAPGTPHVGFDPITDLALPADFKVVGLQQCGEQVDLIWGFNGPRRIYLMREKGHPEEVFVADNKHTLGQPAFDGRYVWFPVAGPERAVLLIDPRTAEVMRFTPEDGLPMYIHGLCAALEEGQACFVGAMDRECRAYVATLSLGSDGARTVTVVHEAVHTFTTEMAATDYRKDPQLSFIPKFAVMGRGPDHQPQLLIGRSLPDHGGLSASLLVRPTGPSAEVVKAAVDSHIISRDVWHEDNAIHWIARGKIKRLSVNSLDTEVVCKAPAEGKVLFYDGRWHVVGQKWWRADKQVGPYEVLHANFPRRHAYGYYSVSAHYGLIMRSQPADRSLYQVRIVE